MLLFNMTFLIFCLGRFISCFTGKTYHKCGHATLTYSKCAISSRERLTYWLTFYTDFYIGQALDFRPITYSALGKLAKNYTFWFILKATCLCPLTILAWSYLLLISAFVLFSICVCIVLYLQTDDVFSLGLCYDFLRLHCIQPSEPA